MSESETCHYRGYEIVPRPFVVELGVGIYRTRADLPLMPQADLATLTRMKEEAVDEAKQKIDRTLSPLDH